MEADMSIMMRSGIRRGVVAGVALAASVLLIMPAVAQTGSPKAPPEVPAEKAPSAEHRDPKACAPRSETTGQQKAQDKALSDKLAQSDGVICPPNGVEPEIKMPAPETGRTPVIPPPGSPGGDPTVRPK
jgi:hypothetical protein